MKDEIIRFQINELQQEVSYLKRRLSFIPIPIQLFCRHLLQFWWSVTALLGLEWLHDGSRQNTTLTAPTITLPALSPADMPTPRLFLDTTITHKSNLNTGVQRVVREICRHGVINGMLTPVIIENEQFVTVTDHAPLMIQDGDKFLLFDAGWQNTSIYPQALDNARARGAEIVLGIYDIIPLTHPGFVKPELANCFDNWLRSIVPLSDAALAISRYSADEFIAWAHSSSILPNIPPVGWFHLGADYPASTSREESEQIHTVKIPKDFLLQVGTVEPRKGHSITLDAFEILWSLGSTLSYVIIGRQGDLSEHVVDRIRNHRLFGKQLFWPKDIDDALLAHYYTNAKALLIPALAEGFGLPLLEAGFYCKPIIASDLPVFREVAPEGVIFFKPADSLDLTHAINALPETAPVTVNRKIKGWSESTSEMIFIVKNNDYRLK
jgi:glycosyltransferase involved in cell wall biosynthesis